MMDTDLSNTVSIHEFMEGIKKTSASLDEVSRYADLNLGDFTHKAFMHA